MPIRSLRVAALSAVVALVVAAPASAAQKSKTQYYVSLGDSYATGFQPGQGSTTDGFAWQTVTKARKRGYNLKLVNFGCGGATTTSIIKTKGCPKNARAVGASAYDKQTQANAASAFLRKHRGQVGLVTVSIGGNDVTACAKPGSGDVVQCVGNAVTGIGTNVSKLVKQLRRAAGSKTLIVGTTYPDVILGQWVRPPVNQDLAKLSLIAFKQFINPGLKKQYGSVHGKFVDVTTATGAYTPLDQMTTLSPYGQIPVAVAKVCQLTWYCEKGDIHSKRAGYGVIADLIVKALPRKKG